MTVRSVLLILLLAALACVSRDARAQDTLTIEYAVKVVCGAPRLRETAPGMYFTAINIHNPNVDSVALRKKFALTLPGERPGQIYPFSENQLLPDQAMEIDCTDIFRRTRAEGFVKGFAVVQSQRSLDIVALYTAAGSTGRVETMEPDCSFRITADATAVVAESNEGNNVATGSCLG